MLMSAGELGDNLAQLVWESFTDFIERRGVGSKEENGESETAVLAMPTVEPEEALIFFMWLHTLALQQASADAPEQVKRVLDAMHQAIYEDLEGRAIPRVQLPLFEQRVTVRYTEYYEAATDQTDEKVVEVAARRVLINGMKRPAITLDLAESATVTSGPLQDFLRDIEIDEG
jgi:cation transport regulator ChaB